MFKPAKFINKKSNKQIMAKKTVICTMCGKIFEVDERDASDHYVCMGCRLTNFRGMKK